jgi:hypothetical protein
MAKKSTTAKPSKAKGTKATSGEQMPLTPEMESAFEKGICLRLIMGSPGFRAKVDSDEVTAGDADTDMLHINKDTLECPEFDSIKQLHGEIKKYLGIRSMPIKTKLLRGTYFIPIDLVADCMAKMKVFQVQHTEELVPAFIKVYDKAKVEAKRRLKHLYDERDYPSDAAVTRAFYIQIFPIDVSASGKLKSVSAQLFEEFNQQMKQMYQSAAVAMRMDLRGVIHKMVAHLTAKLAEPEDGKRKVLRKSAVGHVEEFLQFFEARNITNDTELKAVMDRLRTVMDGVDPVALKKDGEYRADMEAKLGILTTELDKLVTTTGRAVKLPGKKKEAA